MTTPTPVVVLPKINWTDPTAVTSYITSVIASVVGVIVVLHPGWTEPTTVQALIPAVGFLVAGGVQIANLIMHRKAQIALLGEESHRLGLQAQYGALSAPVKRTAK